MSAFGTGNVVGIRSGPDNPAIVAPHGQFLRILFAHIIGGVLPRHREVGLEEGQVGFEALGQVRAHRAPVIHLHIDVMPIAPRPWHQIILAPGSLQIGGQTLFARTGYQQVAAVLEH